MNFVFLLFISLVSSSKYIYQASYPPVFLGWWPFLIKTDINKTFEPLKNARSHPDPVSSHVLDTTLGLPARNLTLTLYHMEDDQGWTKLQHLGAACQEPHSDTVSHGG